jgi:hypothetical protein
MMVEFRFPPAVEPPSSASKVVTSRSAALRFCTESWTTTSARESGGASFPSVLTVDVTAGAGAGREASADAVLPWRGVDGAGGIAGGDAEGITVLGAGKPSTAPEGPVEGETSRRPAVGFSRGHRDGAGLVDGAAA